MVTILWVDDALFTSPTSLCNAALDLDDPFNKAVLPPMLYEKKTGGG